MADHEGRSRLSASARAGRVAVVAIAFAASSSCRRADPAKLVVGVQGEPLGPLVRSLHVQIRVNGATVKDETIARSTTGPAPFPPLWEAALSPPGSGADAKVDVAVDALGEPGAAPFLTRLASTRFVAGHTELLRVPLEARCMVFPPPPKPTAVPGPLSGPACVAPETCILGACRSSAVAPEALEPYGPDWPTNLPDRCKHIDDGPPELLVGTGSADFLPLAYGQTLQAEPGPQGGHHLWIAARMKNLKQRRTTTRIEGRQPETGAVIPPTTFIFTFAPVEGGHCDVHGLRYQLDNGGIDYKPFLGKPLEVTVTLTDPTGATVKATTRVEVAPTLADPPAAAPSAKRLPGSG